MQKFLVIVFIFLSFITRTIAEPGTHPIFSRLTYSDIFGAFALILGIRTILASLITVSEFSKAFTGAFVLLICFFLPVLFSLNIQSTIVECLVLLFLILLSVEVFYLYKDNLLKGLIPLILYMIITSSVLGFYDLGASIVGLPRLFPQRTDGEALSGFRNAGQAGAYYLVILSILIPLRSSSLYNYLSGRNKKLLSVAIVISLIFIALTGKIAAYAGLLVGLIFFLIYKRDIKTLFVFFISGLLMVFIWNNLEDIAPDTYNRIQYKYNARVVETLSGESENDFMQKNYSVALQAFEDRPLIGSVIGAFAGSYSRHEVHSTYLKIVGETGLIGMIGYAVFMVNFLLLFRRRTRDRSNPYYNFLSNMYPFVLGCLISWSYTYHLRKREFWIFFTLILIVNYQGLKFKNGNHETKNIQ